MSGEKKKKTIFTIDALHILVNWSFYTLKWYNCNHNPFIDKKVCIINVKNNYVDNWYSFVYNS